MTALSKVINKAKHAALPLRLASLILLLCTAHACTKKGTPYEWNLPPDIPAPYAPADNPVTVEKVSLGKMLFYDTRLSGNSSQSCASCHQAKFAFTDAKVKPIGSTGDLHHRNAQSLVNVGYNTSLTWAQPELTLIERQIHIPFFSDDPVEMNVSGNEKEILQRLSADIAYPGLFAEAFPHSKNAINFHNITLALASFCRTLVSFGSRFDRYAWYGEDNALNDSELRGLNLFMSEALECRHCHGGFNFSQSSSHRFNETLVKGFHNTGLYNPADNVEIDQGLFEWSGKDEDRGLFRPPSLRNVAYTAPYMHDGSIATLEEVIDFYAAGGRVIDHGKFAGDGRLHPNKSLFLHGFTLSAEQKKDLLAFLNALSDPHFINNPEHQPPN